MSDGLWETNEVKKLLHDPDPLSGLFECYRRIWDVEDAFEDKYLAEREYRTRLLEQEFYQQCPDLYSNILDRVGGHPIGTLDSGCGIIMDALSIREGFQLTSELSEEHNWSVEFDWAATETVPTETEFIADAWFGANGGKQASMKHDNVAYVGEPEVPQLPNKPLEFVWSRFPDKRLHGAQQGQYTLTSLDEVYEEAKQLLVEIIQESNHTEFLVSSDHGYVNFSGSNPYTLTDEFEGILSDKFSGRFHEVTNSGLLRKLEQNDITQRAGGYYMVKGHYNWTTRSATSKITHGGLSVPEIMTPVLRLHTGDA